MKRATFIHDDFLLQSAAARELYHRHAHGLPIIDYHCHLPPEDLAADRQFENLTQIWLSGDHYKWRALRTDGVMEHLITGNATDREKFDAYAASMPRFIKNPLYHWTHMELADPFGIRDRLLSPATADFVWDHCNALLGSTGFTARAIVQHFRVEVICTTDDPADSLEHHRMLSEDEDFPVAVYPTFRPDSALAIESPETWNAYLERLGEAAGMTISRWDDLLLALANRAAFFARCGCRLADCGIGEPFANKYTLEQVRTTFQLARIGKRPNEESCRQFRSALLHELGLMYHALDWTWQLHIGAIRKNNSRFATTLGADTGHDSIGDKPMAAGLSRMLDRLDREDKLPRTILYNLNPADNELFATMAGNFQQGPTPGKIQYGSAWWFLDQKCGIERQIETLGNLGVLARFVGMVTDSRSFLSYSRHEDFRRVLCNVLGSEIEQGLIPRDFAHIGSIVRAICHGNAQAYFGFEKKTSARVSAV